jgi:iron complex transport system substrate-binding protein
MIGHASEVKDKLEELGIPVLVDLSSSEPHPLGRTEWIRLYGVLLNKEEKAEALFQEQKDYLTQVLTDGNTGKTAAFFYISTSGRVVVRKSGDYVSKMIDLAGGKYIFDQIGDPEKSTSTVTIDMETFFAGGKDADVIFYNSTIAGEVSSIAELLMKNDLLAEFKAVKEGNVWCTSQNMYQDTTNLGQMIQSLHLIFTGEADGLDELPYFYRIR